MARWSLSRLLRGNIYREARARRRAASALRTRMVARGVANGDWEPQDKQRHGDLPQRVRLFYRAGRPPQCGPIPRVGTYAAEYELWGNSVSANTPITDRELAEIEPGALKPRGKRQGERDGRLGTLAVRFGED